MHCIVCVCIALYANKPTTTTTALDCMCVCVHCVCIACALRAMPICIGPRQGLVTAHDRYARQTGAGVHCAGLANVYRAEARTLPYALRKMRLHCVLCICALRFMRVYCVLCVCIAFWLCFIHMHCIVCVCIALYANKPTSTTTTTALHCMCVHCVWIACALRCMHVLCTSICIGPRQWLVTAHDRYMDL